MKEAQDAFVQRRTPEWTALEALVQGGRRWHTLSGPEISRAAAQYRAIAADLMHAQAAGYTPDLVAFLDGLAARAHAALYSAPPYRWGAAGDLVWRDFPRTLRRHVRAFCIALALFLLPCVAGFVGAYKSRRFALQIMPEEAAEQMEAMYSQPTEQGRAPGADSTMAGFYVRNNVGIAFQCFATGILFGLGSVFYLVYNGLMIGAAAGVVTAAGHGENFFTFVCGHSAFELTAIIISGMAGMVMGYALVDTQGLGRWASLRSQSRQIAYLILGAALMLLIAAAIEGFWSPSPFAPPVKWSAAAVYWLLVVLYFVFAGRSTRVVRA